jgi:hypothetical protein
MRWKVESRNELEDLPVVKAQPPQLGNDRSIRFHQRLGGQHRAREERNG